MRTTRLSVGMVSRGFNLSGIVVPTVSAKTTNNIAEMNGNEQVITTEFKSGQYVPIVVQKGVPVKWIINVTDSELNGCNNPVTVPKYNITKKLVPGKNVITFTPTKEGTITYTCWMGMIRSTIKVVNDTSNLTPEDAKANSGQPSAPGGGCCALMNR